MASFKDKLQLATKGDCIIKQGKPLFNPTLLEIKEAQRKLSANVSGSISQCELIYKPKTQTDSIVFDCYVIPLVTLLFN